MKKVAITIAISLAVLVTAAYLFREPLLEAAAGFITRDMFVAADADDFDPGVAVGETLPELRALHQGRVVTSVHEFLGPKGLVLVAARSVDW